MDMLKEASSGYGPFVAGGAVLISTTVALIVAVVTIVTHRSLARKRATLDLIIKSETDEYFQNLTKKFVIIRDEDPAGALAVQPVLEKLFYLHRNRTGEKLMDLVSEKQADNFKTVQYYLNYYELVAVGIDNKILDEKFYKHWMRTSFITTWRDCKDIIFNWREIARIDTYFCRFEFYARKWKLPAWKRALLRCGVCDIETLDPTDSPPTGG